MKRLEPPGLGEDLALSFKTSKCQPPLRAEEAEDKWGGGQPGMIRATGAVGIRSVGLGGPLSADPQGKARLDPSPTSRHYSPCLHLTWKHEAAPQQDQWSHGGRRTRGHAGALAGNWELLTRPGALTSSR